MHKSTMLRMEWFLDNYVGNEEDVKILDVGSYCVNGSYKDLLKNKKAEYVGLDIEDGPNVDIVVDEIYNWDSVEDEGYDFIISGQAFEHIEYPWLTIKEMYKKLKKNGIVCIIAPNSLWEHKYPYDCYRYFADGMVALAKWAGLKIIEISVAGIPQKGVSSEWDDPSNDVCLIAGKFDKMPEYLVDKKIFLYERRFDFDKNLKLHYEFLYIWSELENKEEIIKRYLSRKGIDKVYIYGYEYVGKKLEKTLKKIEMKYEIIDTDYKWVSDSQETVKYALYPGVISLEEKCNKMEDNSIVLLTIFDYWRDYNNYLKKKYPGIESVYLYDIIEESKYEEFLKKNEKIYVYGAGVCGKIIKEKLNEVGVDIEGFVVTDGYKKVEMCCDKRVYELKEMKKDDAIMVSLESNPEILCGLREKGFRNIIDGTEYISVRKYTDKIV